MNSSASSDCTHRLLQLDPRCLASVESSSVDLFLCAPAAPLVPASDTYFSEFCPKSKQALDSEKGSRAFELIHKELDQCWAECWRVLKAGGIACIKISDAIRCLNHQLALYPNHSRILNTFLKLGFTPLPLTIWLKHGFAQGHSTGSGLLPLGTYSSIEHEYILVFRKGGKREFKTTQERKKRARGAFFWEERNKWFSDRWDFVEPTQQRPGQQPSTKSSNFPLEIAFRLINMYSLPSDLILDPFTETGSTLLAAQINARNSIGVNPSAETLQTIQSHLLSSTAHCNARVWQRIADHALFVNNQEGCNGPLPYLNKIHGFPVMSKQETDLLIPRIDAVELSKPLHLQSCHSPITCRPTLEPSLQKKNKRKAPLQLTLGF